jgi:hypothetical protein
MRTPIVCLIVKNYLSLPTPRRNLGNWLQSYRGLAAHEQGREIDRLVCELTQGVHFERPLSHADARLLGGFVWDYFNHFTICFLAWQEGYDDPLETGARVRTQLGDMAGGMELLEHHTNGMGLLDLARAASRAQERQQDTCRAVSA